MTQDFYPPTPQFLFRCTYCMYHLASDWFAQACSKIVSILRRYRFRTPQSLALGWGFLKLVFFFLLQILCFSGYPLDSSHNTMGRAENMSDYTLCQTKLRGVQLDSAVSNETPWCIAWLSGVKRNSVVCIAWLSGVRLVLRSWSRYY